MNPDTPAPPKKPDGDLWKVSPFPYGTTPEIIQQWADSQKWSCAPVKMLGPKAWLVASTQDLPASIMTFNGHPLILKLVKNHHADNQTGIVAGPRAKQTFSQPLPPLQGDPWTDYLRKKTGQTTSSQDSASSSASHVGPTGKHLQMQDSKISKLEAAFTQLKSELKETVGSQDARLGAIEKHVQDSTATTAQLLHGFQLDFQKTLNQAMQHQEARLTTTIDGLKSCFHRGSKRSGPHDDPNDLSLDSGHDEGHL